MEKIKNNSIVVFNKSTCSKEIYEEYYKDIFEGKSFIYLGEIPNAPGHCILGDLKTGKVMGMFHTENFRELDTEIMWNGKN